MGNYCGTVDVDRPRGHRDRRPSTVYAPSDHDIDVDEPAVDEQKQDVATETPLPYQSIRMLLGQTREKIGCQPLMEFSQPRPVQVTKIDNKVGLRVHIPRTDPSYGPIVTKVWKGGAAENAGFSEGMRILRIHDRNVENSQDRAEVAEAFKSAPDKVPFDIIAADPTTPGTPYSPLIHGSGAGLEVLLHAARTRPFRNLHAVAHMHASQQSGMVRMRSLDQLLRATTGTKAPVTASTSSTPPEVDHPPAAMSGPDRNVSSFQPAGTPQRFTHSHSTPECPNLVTPAPRLGVLPDTPTAVHSPPQKVSNGHASIATTATSPTSSVGPPPEQSPALGPGANLRRVGSDGKPRLTGLDVPSTEEEAATRRTKFSITFQLGNESRSCSRYYNDFKVLRGVLPQVSKCQFPGGTGIRKCSGGALEKRRVSLKAWLASAIAQFGSGGPEEVSGRKAQAIRGFLGLTTLEQWSVRQ